MRDILFSHTLGRGSAEVSPFPSRRAGPAWPGGDFSIVTCSWEAPGPQSRRDFRPDPTRLLPAGWRSGCRCKGPQVGGFILSQVPLIKVSAGPRPPPPPGGPRGGTFWPLPAPGGFRRPTRTKSRAQLQDLESPGRVTAVSVCLHLYVASLPLGQMSVWAPCSRALVTSGPSITQGLPPTLASFVTPANTLLLRNFTFTGSWGWDPLSSGATSRLSRLSRSPTKAGPWNPRLTKSQTLNVPCSAAIFQFNWLEMDLAGRDVPGNGWV